MEIIKSLVSESKYGIKCPYAMTPTRIVVHNTANNASAKNEVAYMCRNNNQVSFHYAVDDNQIVQAVPENRNAWHSGDGNGKGNREGIAIEICYSKSGGAKFDKAEQNAVELIADILKRYGWGVDKGTKHQDYNGKYCPHRTLDLGWDRFISMIEDKLNPKAKTKSVDELAKEIIAGVHGNGHDARRKSLEAQGYTNYEEVRARVNELLGAKAIAVPQVNYYPQYKGASLSIVTALNSLNVDSSFINRKRIAVANGITNYKGTSAQNISLVKLLKQGKLIKP